MNFHPISILTDFINLSKYFVSFFGVTVILPYLFEPFHSIIVKQNWMERFVTSHNKRSVSILTIFCSIMISSPRMDTNLLKIKLTTCKDMRKGCIFLIIFILFYKRHVHCSLLLISLAAIGYLLLWCVTFRLDLVSLYEYEPPSKILFISFKNMQKELNLTVWSTNHHQGCSYSGWQSPPLM